MQTYQQMMNGTQTYHSDQEKYFHQKHPDLLYNSEDKPFDFLFMDRIGDKFKAVGDFYDITTGWWIELKSSALNKHKLLSAANGAKESALKFATTTKTKTQAILNHGWNHSIEKQKIVQQSLKEKGINFVVLFTSNTKLTFRANGDINTMKSMNLFWLYEYQYFVFRD